MIPVDFQRKKAELAPVSPRRRAQPVSFLLVTDGNYETSDDCKLSGAAGQTKVQYLLEDDETKFVSDTTSQLQRL